MSVEAFLTWLVTVNDLDAIFNDRRGSGSCLKRRLLLVWLIKRVSWFYIWFLIAVSLCTCRRSNEDFFESPRPSLAKEGSTFSPSPSSSGSGDVTALRCSEPLRYKVGGASKPSPWLCGMGPPYYSSLIRTALLQLADWGGMATICYSLMIGGAWGTNCWLRLPFLFLTAVLLCTCRHSNEEYCFILLLRGLLLGRFPSGLWRKSYDRHWRLMNDHNDRGCHLW